MSDRCARALRWLLLPLVLCCAGCGAAPPPATLPIPPTTIIAPVATTAPATVSATVLATTPTTAVPTRTPTPPASPAAARRADIPAKTLETLRYIQAHNGDPPPGYVGGAPFQNRERRLPPGRYKEYDVDPQMRGGRNAERLVIEQGNGRAYYTPDHYESFIPIPAGG